MDDFPPLFDGTGSLTWQPARDRAPFVEPRLSPWVYGRAVGVRPATRGFIVFEQTFGLHPTERTVARCETEQEAEAVARRRLARIAKATKCRQNNG